MSHDPSEIILIFRFGAQEAFLTIVRLLLLLLLYVENGCEIYLFYIYIILFLVEIVIDYLINRRFKRTELI